MHYPLERQQQLTTVLSNLTSQGNSTLPLLLEANAFISDILALSFAGDVDSAAVLDVASAVAASPAASTGFGLYLLVQPVVEALQQLLFFTEVLVHVKASQDRRQQNSIECAKLDMHQPMLAALAAAQLLKVIHLCFVKVLQLLLS